MSDCDSLTNIYFTHTKKKKTKKKSKNEMKLENFDLKFIHRKRHYNLASTRFLSKLFYF